MGKQTAWVNKDQLSTLIPQLEPGDLLELKKSVFFAHWVIYLGQDDAGLHKVVHLDGEDRCNIPIVDAIANVSSVMTQNYVIKEQWLDDLICSHTSVRINNQADDKWTVPFSRDEIVARAKSTVGGRGAYNIQFKNCEHFANWCRYDHPVSLQFNTVWLGLSVAAAAATIGALTGAFLLVKNRRH